MVYLTWLHATRSCVLDERICLPGSLQRIQEMMYQPEVLCHITALYCKRVSQCRSTVQRGWRCACSLFSDLSRLSSDSVYHAFSICRGDSSVRIVIHVLIVDIMSASDTTAVCDFLAVFPAHSNYHKGADMLRFEPTTCGCAVSGVPGAGGNSPFDMPLSHGGDDDSVWPGRPRGGIAGYSERPSPKTALLLPSLAVGTGRCAVGDP